MKVIYCEATDDEINSIEIEEAKNQKYADEDKSLNQALVKIKKKIQAEGEYTEGNHMPSGERFLDTQNVYGGEV